MIDTMERFLGGDLFLRIGVFADGAERVMTGGFAVVLAGVLRAEGGFAVALEIAFPGVFAFFWVREPPRLLRMKYLCYVLMKETG